MKKYLIDIYTFLILVFPYSVCQAMETLIRGAPAWVEEGWFFETMRNKFLSKHATMTSEDRDGRYKYSFDRIAPGSKVLDLGCGGGRLQLVLKDYDRSIRYLGVDFDKDLVEEAQASGRSVIRMDFSNLGDLESLLAREKPDVVYIMYAIDSIRIPEKIIEVVARHSKKIIFGGKNHGHYVQRLRFLFGMAPVTGQSLYEAYLLARAEQNGVFRNLRFAADNWPRDNHNYQRIWTHREYVATFEDLELDWEVVAYRGFRIGKHSKRMIFGSLRAVGIQYCLKPRRMTGEKQTKKPRDA